MNKMQRESKRAVDNYNREARKHNAQVKKNIDNHNREVRTYNTAVRKHNREVDNQRRRLRAEIARLDSRPRGTTFVTYRTSTQHFIDSYETAEDTYPYAPPDDRRILDLVSDEAANSVALVNTLDGADEDTPARDTPGTDLTDELAYLGSDLTSRWDGALYSLSPHNPDAARHFCTSAREVVIAIIDNAAPDETVTAADSTCELHNGRVPRRAKINYLLTRRGVTGHLTDIVDADIDNVMTLFRTFNDGTHGHAGRFTITELGAIRRRVESAITFLHDVIAPAH